MIEISEFSKRKFRLNKYQLRELNKFLYFLNTKKNLKNVDIKVIDKSSFVQFQLYAKKPLYKTLSRSIVAYVD